jgi:hypothetical protein
MEIDPLRSGEGERLRGLSCCLLRTQQVHLRRLWYVSVVMGL